MSVIKRNGYNYITTELKEPEGIRSKLKNFIEKIKNIFSPIKVEFKLMSREEYKDFREKYNQRKT